MLFESILKKDFIPQYLKDNVLMLPLWGRVLTTAIATPVFVVVMILIGLSRISLQLKILYLRFRTFQLRQLLFLCDRWKWYEKKLFKKRVLYYASILIFSRYNVVNVLTIAAATKVVEILMDGINNIPNESEDTYTVPHQGAPEEISSGS